MQPNCISWKNELISLLMKEVQETLKQHKLKITPNRKKILAVFRGSDFALSYNDIDASLSSSLDKVTVYRTLKCFEESGIIHQILDGSSQVKYALCHNGTCSSHDHHDAHLHFRCESCDKTFCLDEVKAPKISLPLGYILKSQSTFVQGICKSCTKQ